jgi:hypothetical protein
MQRSNDIGARSQVLSLTGLSSSELSQSWTRLPRRIDASELSHNYQSCQFKNPVSACRLHLNSLPECPYAKQIIADADTVPG